ncbi:hypothetical protein [Streptomyces iconiensis]|uniref:Uncharacterized protein n=1 Tax=Streptomyces iconiensis TaxID=1384038 RepID=A0ABT7A5G0_9ACTN|nr:hypothetical protein [Streptomyces iconiensis]MDJ1136076.1 hypothetical protein [Streptomyces iconiensis]
MGFTLRGASRKKKTGIVVSGVLGLVLAGGGVAFAAGAFDDWRDSRSVSSACGELLDHTEAKQLLGAPRLQGEKKGALSCEVSDPGDGLASLDVRVQRAGSGERVLAALGRADTHRGAQTVSPVGGTWPAVLNTGDESAYAGAYLACDKGTGDDFVVSVAAHRDPSAQPLNTPDQRASLARTVTGALRSAANRQGCPAPGASPVNHVPKDTVRQLKRAPEMTGTCAGTGSRGYETAADGSAPIEDCLLADAKGNPRFRLSASYGPYVNAVRSETIRGSTLQGLSGGKDGKGGKDGTYWTSATCPGSKALYVIEPLDDGDRFAAADPPLEKRALSAFATASAERHGCRAPSGR